MSNVTRARKRAVLTPKLYMSAFTVVRGATSLFLIFLSFLSRFSGPPELWMDNSGAMYNRVPTSVFSQ